MVNVDMAPSKFWSFQTQNSQIPFDSEEVRARKKIKPSEDLANMEGYSPDGARRTAAHALTPWVLGHTRSSQLAIVWLDPQSGQADTTIVATWPWRKALGPAQLSNGAARGNAEGQDGGICGNIEGSPSFWARWLLL